VAVKHAVMMLNEMFPPPHAPQYKVFPSLLNRVVDPDSVDFWIRILNPDPVARNRVQKFLINVARLIFCFNLAENFPLKVATVSAKNR
jgi:hypothetical protein